MTDFYQHRLISTLHQLTDPDLEERQELVAQCARTRPISLVMPALYSEVGQPAFARILEQLSRVNYIGEIVFSMNHMGAGEFRHAREFMKRLPASQRYSIIWNDGPRVAALYRKLAEASLTSYVPGKGYNVWMAYGFILARGDARVVSTHDSDIISYHRDMLWRLCLPTAHPTMGYEFCKSYYGRVSDRMYGRVTRLFVLPLLRAMLNVIGAHPMLEYLESFRYPLSGESSMSVDLAKVVRIPGDWGLEIGTLCEIYRNTTMRRICQVDLGINFEHKHRHLGADGGDGVAEPGPGLMKMARDIAATLIWNLSSDGVSFGSSMLRSIRLTYVRMAKEIIEQYQSDAILNDLSFLRHEESAAVEAFCQALESAAGEFASAGFDAPHIPSWNRVFSALPRFGEELIEAVEGDGGE